MAEHEAPKLQAAERALPGSLLPSFGLARLAEARGDVVVSAWGSARGAPLVLDSGLNASIEQSPLRELLRSALAELEAGLRREAGARMRLHEVDTTAPSVILDKETLAGVTQFPFAVVVGIASDDTAVTSVLVNGQPAWLRVLGYGPALAFDSTVEFVARVELKPGENTLTVEARDAANNLAPPLGFVVRHVPVSASGSALERRWALCVGAWEPGDPGRTDSLALMERLGAGIPDRQIEKLVDGRARAAGIRQALKAIAAAPADEILVYVDLRAQVVHVGTERRVYLVPTDAVPDDLPGTSIEAGELLDALLAARAQRAALILNGEHVEEILRARPAVAQAPGRVIVGAAAVQVAVPAEPGGKPIFPLSALATIDRGSPEAGGLSLFTFHEQTSVQVAKATGGAQQAVRKGDVAAARAFVIPVRPGAEKVLGSLVGLWLEGQLSRRALVRGASVLVRGFSTDDPTSIDIDSALRRFGRSEIDVKQLESMLTEERGR